MFECAKGVVRIFYRTAVDEVFAPETEGGFRGEPGLGRLREKGEEAFFSRGGVALRVGLRVGERGGVE